MSVAVILELCSSMCWHPLITTYQTLGGETNQTLTRKKRTIAIIFNHLHDLYLITIQAISLFGAIYPRNQHQHSAVFHVFLLIFLGWVEHGASRPSELLYLRCCSHLCHLCASGDQNCDCINKKFTTLMILTKQVTHFVAWFSLDQRRQLAHRDGCICCYTHKNFEVQYLRKLIILMLQQTEIFYSHQNHIFSVIRV